jgi:hypothetical protein
MEARCQTEIIELHAFFERWFTGRVESSEAQLTRVAEVLAPDFRLISPRGVVDTRGPLLAAIRRAHGARRRCRIWIEDCRCRTLGPGLCLATYQEWQEIEGETTARLSTAIFRPRPDAPNGIEWVHLHETWLPRPSPAVRAREGP